ncbi:hypothetical protein F8M41_014432 [Gigaspora margarita]|uniref:Uncharacterized protein n=1 Tax=Gigaspora margarita TaxID=4874 RepID=A0A8H3ZXN4_GIGMA|nr:hypothetical protein F8M41_014432 [Gigaspora margarita]
MQTRFRRATIPTTNSTASTNVTETPVTTPTPSPTQPSATLIAIIVGIVIAGILILCSCWYRRRRQRILPTLTPTSRTVIGRPSSSYESAKRLEASSMEFRNRTWEEPISNIYKPAQTHSGSGADGSEVKPDI